MASILSKVFHFSILKSHIAEYSHGCQHFEAFVLKTLLIGLLKSNNEKLKQKVLKLHFVKHHSSCVSMLISLTFSNEQCELQNLTRKLASSNYQAEDNNSVFIVDKARNIQFHNNIP
jgi:hypothetical protein